MSRIKRTRYLFFHLEDGRELDLTALDRGAVELAPGAPELFALSILTGARYQIGRSELDVLLSVPADRWVAPPDDDHGVVHALVERGLLLSDAEDEPPATLRERDAGLHAAQWHLYAALYHFMTQWDGVDVRTPGSEGADLPALSPVTASEEEAFRREHGPAPPVFAPRRSHGQAVPLPPVERTDGLYASLLRRATARAFDRGVPMTTDQLSTLLFYVFGAHGFARTLGDAVIMRRTSPSGGGLHPVEAYALISNVSGIAPGAYHYSVEHHALDPLFALSADAARATATDFTCGQSYFGEAHVSFVLSARFSRAHWKYRRHEKAYAAILMDAAHLSQTLYLVSAQLGLGAYVTVAVNGRDIEARLGLDGWAEGVVAMAGCGPRRPAEHSPLEPPFVPDLALL